MSLSIWELDRYQIKKLSCGKLISEQIVFKDDSNTFNDNGIKNSYLEQLVNIENSFTKKLYL